MTPEQIELVKSTWELVKPISEQAAALFYGRLFALDPSLQPLFNSDMKVQGQKLMSTINLAVVSLHKLDDILPAVQALGKQHAAEYGVPDSSYETVGAALLWTLGQGLGEAFTPEAMDAWAETYSLLANTMIQAAHAPSA